MRGPSQIALKNARESLNSVLGGPSVDAARLGEDLLAVSSVVRGSGVLRRNLADPTREGRDRGKLIDRLFAGRIGDSALEVARAVAAQRWTVDADLPAAMTALGVESVLAHAQQAGRLRTVEDELFRFERIVAGQDELLAAMSDPKAPASAKTALMQKLLSDKAAPETVRLATLAVTSFGRFDSEIRDYLQIAATRLDEVTAIVTTADALSEAQLDRLEKALVAQYGKQVHVNVVIDPEVIGGLRVEIGDEIIEGTISSRLDDARRRLTS
ncbi:F0F1 ATP synthase subunit delta [Ornithinimicrobium sp. Arc0846-15]|nr:F0F1 ATP synthase subunit delta [Ornithinimicrobium laminariae]